VIHKPYYRINEDGEEISKTFLGSIECGVFTSEYNYSHTDDYDARNIKRNFAYRFPFHDDPIWNPNTFEPHIAATLNRFGAVEKALELLKPNVTMRIGGSGNKSLYIIENQADYLIHTVKSMKYWDVCAVEAMIRGRFGIATDKDRLPIIYEPAEKGNFTIPNGLILARSQAVYDVCYDRLKDYLATLKVEGGRSVK